MGAVAACCLPVALFVADFAAFGAEESKSSGAGKSSYPQIVETIPKIGEKAVSTSLKEISIRFDRDMSKGMSWTGGGPDLPTVDKGNKPHWTDARTCVLPVKLEKGKYYRVGINSKSNQNFRSQDGVPVPPAAIYFTTEGADKALESRVEAPTIVEMPPKNGATDVDAELKTLTVKFSAPMGDGMSWTGGGATYPKSPSGQKANWSADGLTCTLPVTLESGREYVLGLNSVSHNNFQSKWGVPLAPVEYTFKTRAN